jgi:hypothetical protein
MSQPEAYNRQTDFTERDGDDTDNAAINTELDDVSLSINEIRENLALIQADDGSLAAGVVTIESIGTSTFEAIVEEVAGGITADVTQATEAANTALAAAQVATTERNAATVARQAAETAQNAAALNSQTAQAAAATATTKRNEAVTARDEAVAAQAAAVAARDTAVAARNTTTEARDTTLAARDTAVTARNETVAARDITITNTAVAQEARDEAEVARDEAVNATEGKLDKIGGDTGAGQMPAGTTAQRPAVPQPGMIRVNTETDEWEGHKNGIWDAISGAARGAVGNHVFYENDTEVTADFTIRAGKNAMTAGPVRILPGVVVTIPPGSRWTIV